MPERIQRKRTKGWRLPPNARCVTRPGKFGNPYKGDDAVERFREHARRMVAVNPLWEDRCLEWIWRTSVRWISLAMRMCCSNLRTRRKESPMLDRDYELEARLLVKWCGWKMHRDGDAMISPRGETWTTNSWIEGFGSHPFPDLSVSLDACEGLIKAMSNKKYSIIVRVRGYTEIRIYRRNRRVSMWRATDVTAAAIARAICEAADQIVEKI